MIGLVELIVFGLLGLTVIYFLVSIYAHSTERERLERAFDADPLQPGGSARDDYIRDGLAQYRHSLRRKLLWLVYILPMALILLTIYVVNSQ